MTNHEIIELHDRQRQMVISPDSLNARQIQTPGITMLFGTLMIERSCGIGLMDYINPATVKKDLLTAAHRSPIVGKIAVLSAAGILQQHNSSKQSSHRTCLRSFAEKYTNNDLFIIEGVDYSVKSGSAPRDATDYLDQIINNPDKPMILAMGFTSKDRLERDSVKVVHPILTQLSHGYAITDLGLVDQEYNPLNLTAQRRDLADAVVGVPATIERPYGRQQIGL